MGHIRSPWLGLALGTAKKRKRGVEQRGGRGWEWVEGEKVVKTEDRGDVSRRLTLNPTLVPGWAKGVEFRGEEDVKRRPIVTRENSKQAILCGCPLTR